MNMHLPILVLGGTGKTGRRVAERLRARDLPVRVGSRSAQPPFDWEDRTTWVRRSTASHRPTFPTNPTSPCPARSRRSAHLPSSPSRGKSRDWCCWPVAVSTRPSKPSGPLLPPALELTIVRSTWFSQNFSEDYFRDYVLAGVVALPAGETPEPFVDADDIADVAVAALTDDRHIGELYELTGPRLLSFAEAVQEIAHAAGRDIRYVPVPLDAFASELAAHGAPRDVVELVTYLFGEVLDGRNAHLADGVQRALGRQPRDFGDYARDAAVTGVWNPDLAQAGAA